jgi:hypothetical protein
MNECIENIDDQLEHHAELRRYIGLLKLIRESKMHESSKLKATLIEKGVLKY